jgi:glycosyltransferase involved in cell wall biosynthesis
MRDLQWMPSREFAEWLGPRLEDADLVHAHMFGAWWAAARTVAAGVPLVASEHNAYTWPGEPHDREMRDALARVDRFYAHSPAAAEYLRANGMPPERLVPGRAPIAVADGRPLAGLPTPRLVFTGRLTPDKGPDVLVEALRLLRSPAATYILGEGPLRPPLEQRVAELGIERRVTFAGWQLEPERWVAGASMLVAPSREEAWSQSVVQAMAVGTPVVGTAVDGLPAVLAEDRGILVEPECPEALARAIDDVLAGRRRPDVDAARAYASQFDPERVAAEYAAAYRELLADP